MNKKDSIARGILGWEANCYDSWYDCEKDLFIHDSYFQPEKFVEHAMLIVNKLEKSGFSYSTNGVSEVHFNDVIGTGDTLAQAITNAACSILENNEMAHRI